MPNFKMFKKILTKIFKDLFPYDPFESMQYRSHPISNARDSMLSLHVYFLFVAKRNLNFFCLSNSNEQLPTYNISKPSKLINNSQKMILS